MAMFEAALIVATLLCSLVAGLVLAFAVVVMPGIGTLSDREFLRAFQAIDGVIQRRQPVFALVWLGSIVALLAALVLGLRELEGAARILLVLAGLVYLLVVHLPTFTINVPLNNRVQALDVDALDEATLRKARQGFEPRWRRWNSIRTAAASLTSVALMMQLLRL